MNEKAKELRLEKYKISKSDRTSREDHYSSAHDMAIMAKELLKYEIITKYTGKYEDIYVKIRIRNFGLLIRIN